MKKGVILSILGYLLTNYTVCVDTQESVSLVNPFATENLPIQEQNLPAKQLRKKYNHGALEEEICFSVLQEANSKETFTRKGILLTYKNAPATVLLCHGFMCSKDDVKCLWDVFFDQTKPDESYNILSFDFRAHGDLIDGQCCSFGPKEKLDVFGAVDFIRSRPDLKNKPIIAYGFSMGAVACILAQSERNLFNAMILDCPFESSDNVIRRAIEQIKFSFCGYEFGLPAKTILQNYAYNNYIQSFIKYSLKTVAKMDPIQVNTCICPSYPLEAIENITIPCFIIGCKNDEKVPHEVFMQLYKKAGGYTKFWSTEGRRHFDSYFYNPRKYARKVKKFIKNVEDDLKLPIDQRRYRGPVKKMSKEDIPSEGGSI